MRNPKMPAPTSSPLDDEHPENLEENIDPDRSIQKGMSPRNLKAIAMVILLGALIIFLLYPRSKTPTIPVVPVKNTSANMVDDLVDGLQKAPVPIAPVEIKDKPAVPVAGGAVGPKEDERIQAALLAPMATTDVSLNSKNAPAVTSLRTVDDRLKAAMSGHQQATSQLSGGSPIPNGSTLSSKTSLLGGGGGGGGVVVGGGGQSGVVTGEAPGNMSHEEFLQRQASGGLAPSNKMFDARPVNTLYEGTIVRVTLTRALKTDLPGIITGKVTTDLYDTLTQKRVLVPRGSEITCSYQSSLLVGQKLVLAACTRLRMPNGKSFSLNAAVASDMQGASGLPAEIDNHFFEMFQNALIVGAASYMLPKSDRSVSMTTSEAGREVAGSIAGSALNRIIDATIGRNILIPPTGTVDIGTPFTLTLTRDVELEPYFAQ